MIYEIDDLATLARSNELPTYLTANWKGSKEILLGYPASLKNRSGILDDFGLIFFANSVIAACYGSYSDSGHAAVVCGIFLGGMLIGAGFLAAGEYARESHGKAIRALGELGETLTKLANWTGLTPARLSSLSNDQVHTVIDEMMEDLAGKVVALDLQNSCKDVDPREWSTQRHRLVAQINDRYDVLNPLGFMPADGYGYYFERARAVRAVKAA